MKHPWIIIEDDKQFKTEFRMQLYWEEAAILHCAQKRNGEEATLTIREMNPNYHDAEILSRLITMRVKVDGLEN